MVDFAKLLKENRKRMAENKTEGQFEDYSDVEGFEEKRGGGQMYFRLFDRMICMTKKAVWDNVDEAFEPPPPGFEEKPIETTNPSNKEKVYTYVKRFDRVIARIIDIKKEKKKFETGGSSTRWSLYLLAKDKRAVLQLTQGKNGMEAVLKRFLKVAPNIDFDRPLLISAFGTIDKGKKKQAVSFRQGHGANLDSWEKVPEYWQRPKAENGQPLDKPAKGEDGSILPSPIHDEDDDTWDYKPQEKFLIKYFVDNVLPKIKENAVKYGATAPAEPEGGRGTNFNFGDNVQIPVVKEKPENPIATSLDDAMTSSQGSKLKRLFKHMGKDPEKVSQKILEASFDELSRDAASYLTYRVERQLAKLVEEGTLEPFVDKKEEAQKKSKSDDDDFGGDDSPKTKKSDDEDEDDDWGAASAPSGGNTPSAEEEEDDMPF